MYDTYGAQQWVARYSRPEYSRDHARALVLDNSGNIYVTGMSDSAYYDYLTIKYDPSGTQQWAARYTSWGFIEDEAYDLAVDSESNVYVTGYWYDSGFDYCTLKYDSSGTLQWAKYYDGTAGVSDVAYAIAVDAVGNAYITGRSGGLGSWDDYATIKYTPLGIEEESRLLKHGENCLRVYPNPMRHHTEISWHASIYNNEQLTLRIFNSAGQLVKSFSNQRSNNHVRTSVRWFGDDNNGNTLPSGVYFLSFADGGFCTTKTLLVIR